MCTTEHLQQFAAVAHQMAGEIGAKLAVARQPTDYGALGRAAAISLRSKVDVLASCEAADAESVPHGLLLAFLTSSIASADRLAATNTPSRLEARAVVLATEYVADLARQWAAWSTQRVPEHCPSCASPHVQVLMQSSVEGVHCLDCGWSGPPV